jgi:large subunit ribosomal protein L17
MEHGKKNRKFGRETKQRKQLMRDLELSLIETGKIITTEAKAKSLRPEIEKTITMSKSNTPAAKKYLASKFGNKAAKKLLSEITPKFTDKNGGYTRIVHMPRRVSDGSKMAIIEFVE